MLLFTDQSGEGIAEVFIFHKVNFYAAYQYGAFHPKGYVVIIVADPNHHFIAVFEYGALYEQRDYFDGIKSAHAGSDLLLTHILYIEIVYLVIQEHTEGYLVAGAAFIVIDIAGKING